MIKSTLEARLALVGGPDQNNILSPYVPVTRASHLVFIKVGPELEAWKPRTAPSRAVGPHATEWNSSSGKGGRSNAIGFTEENHPYLVILQVPSV